MPSRVGPYDPKQLRDVPGKTVVEGLLRFKYVYGDNYHAFMTAAQRIVASNPSIRRLDACRRALAETPVAKLADHLGYEVRTARIVSLEKDWVEMELRRR